MRPRILPALAVTAAAAAAAAAAGQDPSRARTQPLPTFGTEVSLVTLPVFVTDSAGKSVGGLTLEAFQVQDEGKPVKVVRFQEIDVGSPTVEAQMRRTPAARRQFLLLFDLSFSTPNGIVQSRRAATDFVSKRLAPTDLAAVATFSIRGGMKLLVSFTSDRAQLEHAISTLGFSGLDRKPDPLELTYDIPPAGMPIGGMSAPTSASKVDIMEEIRGLQVMRNQAESATYRQQVAVLIDSMGQLGHALDAAQGRKQIIYLSAGFKDATLAGAEGSEAVRNSQAVTEGRLWEVDTDSHFGDASVRGQMEKMLQSFAGSDCVIHTVDVSGLTADKGDVTQAQGTPDARSSTGQQSLTQIAAGTGGRFFKNTNDLDGVLGEILEASRRYYVLAFEPPGGKGPGRFHKLKVRVEGKALSVSHRRGYFEPLPFDKQPLQARRLDDAQQVAKGVVGGAVRTRALAVPYRRAAEGVQVPVVLEIDGPSLLDRGAGGGEVRLAAYGYALSDGGRVEDFYQVKSRLDLAKVGDRLKESGLQLHSVFTLPPGRHSLRFLVRDEATGRGGSTRVDLEVPELDPRTATLAPPLVMEDPGRWIVVPAASRTAALPEMPFRVASDAFVPRPEPLLHGGRAENVCLMAFDAGARLPESAVLELRAELVDGSGGSQAVRDVRLMRTAPDRDGIRRIVVSLTPEGVAPGAYDLKLTYEGPNPGQVRQSSLPVRVGEQP
jgi:VWFA-related protein